MAALLVSVCLSLLFLGVACDPHLETKELKRLFQGLERKEFLGAGREINKLKSIVSDQSLLSNTKHRSTASCVCKNLTCGCCQHVEVEIIGLNDTVCANIQYLPAPKYGIAFNVSLDGKVYIHEEVSVKDPPPVCAAIPYLKDLASICLRFHDLIYSNHTLSGCIALEARIKYVEVETIQLGCFKIPPGASLKYEHSSRSLVDKL